MITDNQDEVFDVVDENDNVIGKATRREVHKNKKLIHRSIGVAIFNIQGKIYLQQRSATKDKDPLLWTVGCSGHVESGDNYEETAKRELTEELGINVPIKFYKKYICRAPWETEMQMIFKAIYEGPFKLNKKEIMQGKFFTRKELNDLVKKGEIKLSFMGKRALEELGWV